MKSEQATVMSVGPIDTHSNSGREQLRARRPAKLFFCDVSIVPEEFSMNQSHKLLPWVGNSVRPHDPAVSILVR
jgi:hypothetical protein